jgi:iron complex outermembrane receptor protein
MRGVWGGRAFRQTLTAWIGCALIAGTTASTWAGDDAGSDAAAAAPDPQPASSIEKYSEMSLEQLLQVKITSVAGIVAPFFASPAAVTVMSGEDLRRDGFQSIPESFRAVPGMQVGRVESHTWAISVRGFNSGFAEKLLVLMDGRTVYDPLFNGVFWDVQDVNLEDLDRIEVIRGPGATLWGANAVNGVINITTKSAKQTQGLYLTTAGGSEERDMATVRYGGRIGDHTYYRVWGKRLDEGSFVEAGTGADQHDDWNMSRGGLRFDIDASPRTTLSFDTEIYDSNHLGTSAALPVPGLSLVYQKAPLVGRARGGHLLFRLNDGAGAPSGWDVTAYFDRNQRFAKTLADTTVNTSEVDVRRHFDFDRHNGVLVGLAWRRVSDDVQPGPIFVFNPPMRTYTTASGFVQDTVQLPAGLSLMVGSKFERNDFTGFEAQPSARLAWTPTDRHTVWGAVSRPVRTPSRGGQDYEVTLGYVDLGLVQGLPPIGLTVPIKLYGNRDARSEKLTAYELGYRTRVGERLAFDVAGYVHQYSDLVTTYLNMFGKLQNLASGRGRGVEVAATLRASSAVRLDAGYTYTSLDLNQKNVQLALLDAPHKADLRAHVDVTPDVEVNGGLYYTGALTYPITSTVVIKRYTRADLGVTWRPVSRLEVAVWGQDLLQPHHAEFPPLLPQPPTEVQRGVYGQITYRR